MNNDIRKSELNSLQWMDYCRPVILPQNTEPDPCTVFAKMADLYVAAYLFLPAKDTTVKLRVTKDLLRFYEIPEKEFLIQCMNHLEEETTIQDMNEVIEAMMITSEEPKNYFTDNAPLQPDPLTYYIVTTHTAENFGASAILIHAVRKKLLECWPDGAYILPSSLHEVICMKKEPDRLEELQNSVKCVNRSEVLPEDWMSDSVYELRPDGKVVLA